MKTSSHRVVLFIGFQVAVVLWVCGPALWVRLVGTSVRLEARASPGRDILAGRAIDLDYPWMRETIGPSRRVMLQPMEGVWNPVESVDPTKPTVHLELGPLQDPIPPGLRSFYTRQDPATLVERSRPTAKVWVRAKVAGGRAAIVGILPAETGEEATIAR
ncbi:MAG: GDYXXLXY domain-containing protein [Myxococcota bacterium]